MKTMKINLIALLDILYQRPFVCPGLQITVQNSKDGNLSSKTSLENFRLKGTAGMIS